MSDNVKIIIEMPSDEYRDIKQHEAMIRKYPTEHLLWILDGTPIEDMTNWEILKSIFPYAEIVGGDETLTAVRIDSNPKVGTPIALYTEWLNAPYSTEPKARV